MTAGASCRKSICPNTRISFVGLSIVVTTYFCEKSGKKNTELGHLLFSIDYLTEKLGTAIRDSHLLMAGDSTQKTVTVPNKIADGAAGKTLNTYLRFFRYIRYNSKNVGASSSSIFGFDLRIPSYVLTYHVGVLRILRNQ